MTNMTAVCTRGTTSTSSDATRRLSGKNTCTSWNRPVLHAVHHRRMTMADTHFGFETVAEEEKARRVAGVFDSVASKYDVMNDLMSVGLHRLWKRFAVGVSGVRAGQRVLDVAGGSADLSRLFLKKVGSSGRVVLTDINKAILPLGRHPLLDAGIATPVAQCDAEHLPFPA